MSSNNTHHIGNEIKAAWGKILAKSWKDPLYRKKVEENPDKALEDEGVTIPQGVTFSVTSAKPQDNKVVILFPWSDGPHSLELSSSPPPPPHGGKSGGGGGASCCSSIVTCCP